MNLARRFDKVLKRAAAAEARKLQAASPQKKKKMFGCLRGSYDKSALARALEMWDRESPTEMAAAHLAPVWVHPDAVAIRSAYTVVDGEVVWRV